MIYLASLQEKVEDKVNGYYIIKTKEELDNVIADTSTFNKVIIRNDFAKEYFTPSGLGKFIDNVKYINKNLTIELDTESKVVTTDSFIKTLMGIRSIEELYHYSAKYPNEMLDTLRYLTSRDIEHDEELLVASNNVSRLQAIIDEKNKEIDNLQYIIKSEQENKFNSANTLNTLISRINYQHDLKIDPNKLFSIRGNNYDRVIYIKEITRVQYVDSFIYYLKEILKVLYSMPTRNLVIESYYSDDKARLYPNLVPHYALKEKDVLSGDVLMLGFQPHLGEDIAKNPSNISILIVLDRAGFIRPHLEGNNIEYFYTASDLKDVPEGVPNSRIISYSEDTLFIPYISGFSDMDNNERITKYSSTGIIKKFIELLERTK